MSESILNKKLQSTIKNIVNSELSKKKSLPENFDEADVEVFESQYGKMCHIYYIFKEPYSSFEYNILRQFSIFLKKYVRDLFENIFKGGVYSSLETRESYDKSIEELKLRLGENKRTTLKVIVTESQVERLVSIFDKFMNSESYEGVTNVMVDYDEVMDKYVLNIFFDTRFAVEKGSKFNSHMKKIINQVGLKFYEVTGMKPLLYHHFN